MTFSQLLGIRNSAAAVTNSELFIAATSHPLRYPVKQSANAPYVTNTGTIMPASHPEAEQYVH